MSKFNQSNTEYCGENLGFLSIDEARKIRSEKRTQGKSIVLTNGCFDLLHVGHIYSLQAASKLGDELWVALNSDCSIRNLKGPNRPIYTEKQRAFMLLALSCVDLVFLFDGINLSQEIKLIQPDLYVKSGDYNLDSLNPQEKSVLESSGTRIKFVPFLNGLSTSSTIAKICSN